MIHNDNTSKVAAVICEYNPFHAGHAYHLAQTRSLGATHIAVSYTHLDVYKRQIQYRTRINSILHEESQLMDRIAPGAVLDVYKRQWLKWESGSQSPPGPLPCLRVRT